MEIRANNIILKLDEETLRLSAEVGGEVWRWEEAYRPVIVCGEDKIYFQDALKVEHKQYTNGLGCGIRSFYDGFMLNGERTDYSFETNIWIEAVSGNVYFEWIPLQEEGLKITKVFWPGPMEFDQPKQSWYTLINERQGLLVPNNWPNELEPLVFDGMFDTAGGYMPWFGQVKDGSGMIAVCETPADAGCYADHPAGGPYTRAGIYLLPSMGQMNYRRIIRYTFAENCDYNGLCKIYRQYVNENGRLRTLAQKQARNSSVSALIGSSFIHQGIKTYVRPDSDFYDAQNPDKNNHLVTFAGREKEIRELKAMGAEKVYLHLDGWGDPGYDNRHPDYLPACEAAGGWAGMRSLNEAMHECGYLFGIHDQYRDYYLSAPSYSDEYACRQADGNIYKHQRWAGGPQAYLCATQAPYYVKRNFSELLQQGIRPDCAYLDVFTCNDGDECISKEHYMTRQDCYDYRARCFEYLLSQNILPSSEEAADWAVPSLVFCHYAPYELMMRKPGAPRQGIDVPLYNLVYHDCLIEPWMMDVIGGEDYMLYALLNGGAPYLIRDGAYPDFDGAYGSEDHFSLKEKIERCRVVADLHEQVAMQEMTEHRMDLDRPWQQEAVYADGTRISIDLKQNTYTIEMTNE